MPTKEIPSYIFLGEEDFLKEEAVNKIVTAFLDKATLDLNYRVFYAKDRNFDIKEMMDFLITMPFLSKKRIAVLKEADSLSEIDKVTVINYLKNPKDSSVLIIESQNTIIKSQFLLEASKLGSLSYFRRLTDSDINIWIERKFHSYNKKASEDAVLTIKSSLPNDLRIFSSNIDNIVLYIGSRPVATKEDVLKVVGASPVHTAFDLIEAIREKDAFGALNILAALKKDKSKEFELIGILAWNARMLLRVKGLLKIRPKLDICKDVGLNPRVFDAVSKQASSFKIKDIMQLLDEVLAADLDIKTGSIPSIVIERLVVKMCKA